MNDRKKYSLQQKLEIVLAGLSSPDGVSKVCRQYGISTVQFYQCPDQAFDVPALLRAVISDPFTGYCQGIKSVNIRLRCWLASVIASQYQSGITNTFWEFPAAGLFQRHNPLMCAAACGARLYGG